MEFHQRADRVVTRPALELHEIRKRFRTVVALDGAGVVVRPGTIHAIPGENGVVETTLMRLAFGMTRPDASTINVDVPGAA